MSLNITGTLNKDLLLGAIDSLDLPPGVYEKAKERYTKVGEFLAEDGTLLSAFSPVVYPQGSAAMGTAIKPLGLDDFDIDIACSLTIGRGIDPMKVREMVETRLKQDGNYSRMLNTEKNRCLRLDYAEAEKFHLDIIAARSASELSPTGTALEVPDREIHDWIQSDPKGYLDWFHDRKKVLLLEHGKEILADVEPAPEQPGKGKAPLQLAIQLLKRDRDLEFEDNADIAPISIIITTLAAKAYGHQADIEEAFRAIVTGMPKSFDRLEPGYAEVLNPTNSEENFADKWQDHPERREAFFQWHESVSRKVDTFFLARGVKAIGESLEQIVGTNPRNKAFESHGAHLNESLKSKSLFSVGAAAALSIDPGSEGCRIPPHTNFGED